MPVNFVSLQGTVYNYMERVVKNDHIVSSFSLLLPAKEGEGSFFDVEAWDLDPRLRETLNLHQKEVRVLAQGKLKQDRWKDKATGGNRSKVKLNADLVTYIGLREKRENVDQSASQAPAAEPVAVGATDESGIPF